jgi:hypothetical protein
MRRLTALSGNVQLGKLEVLGRDIGGLEKQQNRGRVYPHQRCA